MDRPSWDEYFMEMAELQLSVRPACEDTWAQSS